MMNMWRRREWWRDEDADGTKTENECNQQKKKKKEKTQAQNVNNQNRKVTVIFTSNFGGKKRAGVRSMTICCFTKDVVYACQTWTWTYHGPFFFLAYYRLLDEFGKMEPRLLQREGPKWWTVQRVQRGVIISLSSNQKNTLSIAMTLFKTSKKQQSTTSAGSTPSRTPRSSSIHGHQPIHCTNTTMTH